MSGGKERVVLYPRLLGGLVLFAQLPQMVVLLLHEVGVLFFLCLVEPVDDGVFPLGHQYLLDLLVVLEADLTRGHAAILLEVGPGGVDDGDVVLLVAWASQRAMEEVLRSLGHLPTLDGVGLGQLGQVGQQLFGDVVPCLALAQAQVNMRAG